MSEENIPLDYSDAAAFGETHHVTGEYQRLGALWDSETSAKLLDTSDDGVLWSVDGGLN